MVFTVVTILFLPLSFLTSLFALDVASFLQAPPWALGVIFSVSFGLFVPMVIAAFTWKRSKEFVREKITKLRDHPMFQPRGNSVDRLQPSIRDQSGTPNQTHSNEGNHGPELGHSEASHQAEPQATNSSTHSSRARKRSDRSTPGDEEMALGFR
ncbi:hypothetical protein K456DRAFT_1147298 [Colletotrichum gloeosporioides 23]|nr:hypothetical protein K456DRAFT_1147298 [Colletotrichum gloeosporioides 23]